jgi:hypothetical protein
MFTFTIYKTDVWGSKPEILETYNGMIVKRLYGMPQYKD